MLCLTLAAPRLAAQASILSPFSLETFAARNESRNAAVFGGLSLAGYSGSWGLRLNTAVSGLNFNSDNYDAVPLRNCNRFGCRSGYGYDDGSGLSVNAWSFDADVIAEPFRQVPVLRQLLLGFSPYAFVGIGRYGENANTGLASDTSHAVWSYGVGVHHELVSRIGFTAEARARRSLDDNAFVGGTFRNAIQYRMGLSVGLGGGVKKKQPTPRIIYRGPIPGGSSAPVPVVVSPAPAPAPSVVDERAADALVPSVLDEAESLLNTRWRSGGTTPDEGFDAGGFVQYVFAQEDIPLPRLIRDLAQTGVYVQARPIAMRAGDLIFFSSDGGSPPDHVAIYVGHDRFVHASASGGGVLYDSFSEGARGNWFAMHLVAVRRVLGTRNSDSRVPPSSLTPSGRPDTAPRPSGDR
jgi:NlpC/P60 family